MATMAEWRKAEGISQKRLAAILSAALGRVVHQSSVCQWENGEIMPGADVAYAMTVLSGGQVIGSTYGMRRCPPA